VFAGAITGAMLVAIYTWTQGGGKGNLGELLDRALGELESGLTL
jgi:hypothetical protein